MPPRKKIKKKAKKAVKKAVRKKAKKAVKRNLKIKQEPINLSSQPFQTKPFESPSQSLSLMTISIILKLMAFIILVVGLISSLLPSLFYFYSWWIGLIISILLWIVASSMKHW